LKEDVDVTIQPFANQWHLLFIHHELSKQKSTSNSDFSARASVQSSLQEQLGGRIEGFPLQQLAANLYALIEARVPQGTRSRRGHDNISWGEAGTS